MATATLHPGSGPVALTFEHQSGEGPPYADGRLNGLALVTNMPVNSVDLIGLAKSKPGKLTYRPQAGPAFATVHVYPRQRRQGCPRSRAKSRLSLHGPRGCGSQALSTPERSQLLWRP